jgi:hypothetical protein
MEEDGRAAYLATHAQRHIDDLASGMSLGQLEGRGCEFALITGAGMSLSAANGDPGMPRTVWLLSLASWATLRQLALRGHAQPERELKELSEPELAHSIAWRAISLRVDNMGATTDALRGCLFEFATSGTCKQAARNFNALFTNHPSQIERDFRFQLRCAVLRYDEGLTYRHWMAARLPFGVRITTNFDGFHQRSAAHVAAHSGNLHETIRLYRGADEPGELAFSSSEFHTALNEKRGNIARLDAGKRVHFIVIGYSFRDDALTQLISGRAENVWWVDPDAYRVTTELEANALVPGYPKVASAFLKALVEAKRLVALPMRASDFLYDLGERYFSLSSQLSSTRRSL